MQDRFWEKIEGYVSENDVDARWILREEGDTRAHGSLRIVSHPDCKPGFLRSYWTVVTNRRPKTQEEIEQTVVDYGIDVSELELYTIDEHIETHTVEHEDRVGALEEMYNVTIFD